MRKRSGTSAGASRLPEPIFFTDRDLGKKFPAILREAGLCVEPYDEHFPSGTVPDEEWLRYVGERHWIAISHDRSQIITPPERDAAMRAGVKVFYVIGSAPYAELAISFLDAIDQVRKLIARHQDPFLAKVYRSTAAQRARVRVYLTFAQWLKKLK